MAVKDADDSGHPNQPQAARGGDWVKLGRHDLAALFHGLRDLREIGAWALLVAHYLSAPGPLPTHALVDISGLEGGKLTALMERLTRLRRVEVAMEQLRIPILDEKLTLAAKATERGRAISGERWRPKKG